MAIMVEWEDMVDMAVMGEWVDMVDMAVIALLKASKHMVHLSIVMVSISIMVNLNMVSIIRTITLLRVTRNNLTIENRILANLNKVNTLTLTSPSMLLTEELSLSMASILSPSMTYSRASKSQHDTYRGGQPQQDKYTPSSHPQQTHRQSEYRSPAQNQKSLNSASPNHQSKYVPNFSSPHKNEEPKDQYTSGKSSSPADEEGSNGSYANQFENNPVSSGYQDESNDHSSFYEDMLGSNTMEEIFTEYARKK